MRWALVTLDVFVLCKVNQFRGRFWLSDLFVSGVCTTNQIQVHAHAFQTPDSKRSFQKAAAFSLQWHASTCIYNFAQEVQETGRKVMSRLKSNISLTDIELPAPQQHLKQTLQYLIHHHKTACAYHICTANPYAANQCQ